MTTPRGEENSSTNEKLYSFLLNAGQQLLSGALFGLGIHVADRLTASPSKAITTGDSNVMPFTKTGTNA